MNWPRILVAAPISEKKDYCLWQWLDSILALSYPNFDIYLVDNSADEAFHKKMWDKGINCDYVKPEGSAMEFITKSQNKIRDYFLANDYDYLMLIECDVFCPENIIQYLLNYQLPVVSGNYFLGTGENTSLSIQQYHKSVNNSYNKVERITAYESFRIFDGTLKQVFATHLGCTLIRGDVVGEIKFRCEVSGSETANYTTFSDTYFFTDCAKKNIPIFVDCGLLLNHQRSSWDTNPDLYKAKLN